MSTINKGKIVIYSPKGGKVRLEVKLQRNTVWLTQAQIAFLFDKDVRTISEHIQNVYEEGELERRPTIRKFRIVQEEGNRFIARLVEFYDLDVIISVGYRVKSKQGTRFRIWAAKVLKTYLVRGYTLNLKRLAEAEGRFAELQKAVALLGSKSAYPQLSGKTQELFDLLKAYSVSLTLLSQYDKKHIPINKAGKPLFNLDYGRAIKIIGRLREVLIQKEEAGRFFGEESGRKFEGIIAGLHQTFGGKELYPSIAEKAAHLLYFTIKDHPFIDGNKRAASVLFIYYLERNGYLTRRNGERKINDSALIALALLVAASDPKEKDLMVGIITNLLKG